MMMRPSMVVLTLCALVGNSVVVPSPMDKRHKKRVKHDGVSVVAPPEEAHPKEAKLETPASSSEGANEDSAEAAVPPPPDCTTSRISLVAGGVSLVIVLAWIVVLGLLLRLPPSENAAKGSRMPILDMAKFLLMIPVINEHTTSWFGPLTLQGTMQYVHFHTRTFCFVSGLTAQGPANERNVRSVVFRLFVPTILWQLIGFAYFDRDKLNHMSAMEQVQHLMTAMFTAPGISWYMYALITWRIMGWALVNLRPAVRFATSFMIMICSGYVIDSPGFLRNAGVYLPIFVAGQLFPLKEVLARSPVATPLMIALGAGMLFAIAVWEYSESGLAFLVEIPYYSWGSIYGPKGGYCDIGSFATYWLRGLFRNVLELSKGLVLILLCCPRSDNYFSNLGQYSLYTYLLHPWFQSVMNGPLRMTEWRPHPVLGDPPAYQWYCLCLGILYAFVVNVICTSKLARSVFSVVLEPAWVERLVGVELPAKDAKPNDAKTLGAGLHEVQQAKLSIQA